MDAESLKKRKNRWIYNVYICKHPDGHFFYTVTCNIENRIREFMREFYDCKSHLSTTGLGNYSKLTNVNPKEWEYSPYTNEPMPYIDAKRLKADLVKCANGYYDTRYLLLNERC